MVVPNKVVEVPVIVVGVVKAASEAFSHLTTAPVLPDKVRSAGELPEQMLWAADTLPPTEVGLTLSVTFCVKVPVQFGVALVAVTPVICKVCPLLAAVSDAELKLAAPEPSAITPVTAAWAVPLIV